jgi:hypothetical protein
MTAGRFISSTMGRQDGALSFQTLDGYAANQPITDSNANPWVITVFTKACHITAYLYKKAETTKRGVHPPAGLQT